MAARRPTALDMQIGQLLRQRRIELELTLDNLSALLQITPHQLQKYEVGENRIAASRLIECARALKIPVAWFYQEELGSTNQACPVVALVGEELKLFTCYRALTLDGRRRLVGIAELLSNDSKKPRRKPR